MKKVSTALMGALLVLALGACSNVNASANNPSPTATENPYGGFAVDAPGADEIILTVIGPNETDEYSITDLKALAIEPIKIMEPFVKAEQTFRGVPLTTLFEAAGIKETDKVSTIALNEYVYDDLASNFTASKALVAIDRDGEDIPMDQGGPIRIVFPSNTKYFTFLDAWNWSLRTIEVKK